MDKVNTICLWALCRQQGELAPLSELRLRPVGRKMIIIWCCCSDKRTREQNDLTQDELDDARDHLITLYVWVLAVCATWLFFFRFMDPSLFSSLTHSLSPWLCVRPRTWAKVQEWTAGSERECESWEASNGNECCAAPRLLWRPTDSDFIKYSLEREGNTRGEKSLHRMLIRDAGGAGKERRVC